MSDFKIFQLMTDDEVKQYEKICNDLKSNDKLISDCFKEKRYDDAKTYFERKRELEQQESDMRNTALSRLSQDKDFMHDFDGDLNDLILESERGDKTLSQRYAASVASLYCKMYPDKDVYKYLSGETLTDYVDRVVKYFESINEQTESVSVTRADKVEYPIDKVNDRVWNLLSTTPDGQIGLGIIVGESKGKNKGKLAVTTYSINFDNLKDVSISKKLTQYDKRVYIATSALHNVGNEVVSLTQIYFAMGHNSRPSDTALKKVYDSIIKMHAAQIKVDNAQEIDVYKKYQHFEYIGSLLPMELLRKDINGKLTEAAIHLFREPPLVTYAKEHKQITTVKVGLLQSPLSKTESNLCLEDYILEQIAHMKRGYRNSRRILFDTLYAETKITAKKQRQRTPPKVGELLTYYKSQKYIKDYTIDKGGIDIIL